MTLVSFDLHAAECSTSLPATAVLAAMFVIVERCSTLQLCSGNSHMHSNMQVLLACNADHIMAGQMTHAKNISQACYCQVMRDCGNWLRTGYAVCILVLATSSGSTADHMMVPAKPPQPMAEVESLTSSQRVGS